MIGFVKIGAKERERNIFVFEDRNQTHLSWCNLNEKKGEFINRISSLRNKVGTSFLPLIVILLPFLNSR